MKHFLKHISREKLMAHHTPREILIKKYSVIHFLTLQNIILFLSINSYCRIPKIFTKLELF